MKCKLTDQRVQLEGEFGIIWNDKGSIAYGNLTLPKWKCEETQLVQQASKCLWRKQEKNSEAHMNQVNHGEATIYFLVLYRFKFTVKHNSWFCGWSSQWTEI